MKEDVYNIAYNYLKDKYGYTRSGLTEKSESVLRKSRNKKERAEILNSFTDRDYVLNINLVTDEVDKIIELLLNQYRYDLGNTVKRELYLLLFNLGVIV